MCGIAGVLASGSTGRQTRLEEDVRRMADTLAHRGPDDHGVWVDRDEGVALGHRRLSIVDLSSAGHQPMRSPAGRYVIAFNGEIYNHQALRGELERSGLAPMWRGHSDTETLLAACDAWGLPEALKRTVGMYAFAVWDRQLRVLTLARDRLGEKPIYYGPLRDRLVFASELKAIRANPAFERTIDRRALALYMQFNYVPAPWSIYKRIWKLPAGCYVQFSAEALADIANDGQGVVHAYWSAREALAAGFREPLDCSEDEAAAEFERLARASIAGQMIADVPLGAFLSGGVDSSTVVALMQAQSPRPVKTFTIGFNEGNYDEARYAKAIARHLGTDHTELYVTPAQARSVIPELPVIYDEPFADASQIPTFLVSRLAASEVTVALSGDGGDELFGGYTRYLWGPRLWQRIAPLPANLRTIAAHLSTVLPPSAWNRAIGAIDWLLPARLRQVDPGSKLHKLARLLHADGPESIYAHLVRHWDDSAPPVLDAGSAMPAPPEWPQECDFASAMMYLDLITYLPDDILVKVDRAAMANGLETRVPLLDHRIVEFAWRLPPAMKIRDGVGKRVLRDVLYKYVPKALIERPKMGFGVPIDQWLRNPLREWAESLLSEARLKREGFLDAAMIRNRWAQHLSGRLDAQQSLWSVLMFQAWLERACDPPQMA